MAFLKKLSRKTASDTKVIAGLDTGPDNELYATDGPTGIKVISDPPDAFVDIVFVHGLTGNREKTWTHRNGTFWPEALLSRDFPRARIMTFGYDADVVRFWTIASSNGLNDHAKSLAYALLDRREQVCPGPIIFITHSLGGLVCEEALTLSDKREDLGSILSNTLGVIFMGTPHGGSYLAGWGGTIAEYVNVFRGTNREILRNLQPGSSELQRTEEDFQHMIRRADVKLKLYCFYEALKMNDTVGKIVERASAIIPAYDNCSINADHRNMTKFSGRADAGYGQVRGVLQRWIQELEGRPLNVIEPERSSAVDFSSSAASFHDLTIGNYPSYASHSTTNMQRTSEYHAPTGGHIVIPASHSGRGGTMNFPYLQPRSDKSAQKHAPFSTVPFAPDPDFVDRPEILAWIRDKCAMPGARAALIGLGGIGKSQLAIRYSHNVRDSTPQPYVFWVHASSKARFEEAYRGIANKLELPRRNDPGVDLFRLVSDWLCDETNGKWLMILDNADDIEVFYPERTRTVGQISAAASASLAVYLPQSHNGSILITSRSKDTAARLAGGYKNVKEVHAMDESRALDLFRNKLQNVASEAGAPDLLRALDYIPLAITQAAAFINRRGRITASGYLDEFRRNDKKKESLLNKDFGDLRRDGSASNSVVATWQMSFECIREQRRSAADLLSLMSFFNPQGIPEWILRRYHSSVANMGDEGEADSAFDEDLDTLQAYSLVTATADGDVYEMHALVQFCTQVMLSSFNDAERWKQKFIWLIALEFPNGKFENWAKCQQLLPHIEPLYEREPAGEESAKEWARVLTNAAWYMWMKGSYAAARDAAAKAVIAKERTLGRDNRSTLASVTLLASILLGQGEYEEAEKLDRRALEEQRKRLGEQHPDTLISMNNLALALSGQEKHDEAEKLHRRALEGSEKELGEQHPNTLQSANYLASALWAQEKYDEAEKLYRRALEGREKELGEKHPDTLESLQNLALVLKSQGRYDEAEKLHRQALEGLEKELSEQHPDTLTSVSNLALVLTAQGKYGEAEKLAQRALEGREKQLGEQHSHTLQSMDNLALVLKAQGKHGETERLYRRALEGREKLGEQHPNTLTSVHNLASALWVQEKDEEAEKLHRRALEGREKELGERHPNTLHSCHCLARLLHMRKRYEEASGLYQRACDGYKQKLGSQHPTSIACLNHYSAMQQEADSQGAT